MLVQVVSHPANRCGVNEANRIDDCGSGERKVVCELERKKERKKEREI